MRHVDRLPALLLVLAIVGLQVMAAPAAARVSGPIGPAPRADLGLGQGPGGPILVITDNRDGTNQFGTYVAEILLTEGFNLFATQDLSLVPNPIPGTYDTVILTNTSTLSTTDVSKLTAFVNAGGNLIALRPDKQLAGLFGLADAASTLSDAYLKVSVSSSPGLGIYPKPMQFHGTADLYALNGATALATLYTSASAATNPARPALTLRTGIGPSLGQAAAFTYDLARSTTYLRQGNPAWAGQKRDNTLIPVDATTNRAAPKRPNDLYFGPNGLDPQPDYVDMTRVAVPQADEQQRLLANLIEQMNQRKKPLPRFWYLPDGANAVAILTGDDHNFGTDPSGTASDFNLYRDTYSSGTCSVARWTCVRSTSYVYSQSSTTTGLSNANAATYVGQGFEIAAHVNTNDAQPPVNNGLCRDWTSQADLDSFFASELGAFGTSYPSLPVPATNRMHCLVWGDFPNVPWREAAHGILLDTTYYPYPGTWLENRPGFMTGSGFPQHFVDGNGNLINVYQAATQMTDENCGLYPLTADTLFDRATHNEQFVGAFVVNAHTDGLSPIAVPVIQSAQARGLKIASAAQLQQWMHGRTNSVFSSVAWTGNQLSFSLGVHTDTSGMLQFMLPARASTGSLSAVTINGVAQALPSPFPFKGQSYYRFATSAGTVPVVATYAGAAPANGTGVFRDDSSDDFSFGTFSGTATAQVGTNTAIPQIGQGEVSLAPQFGSDFSERTLDPTLWDVVQWAAPGTQQDCGGVNYIDGGRVGTVQRYTPPGLSLEFSAQFTANPFQHAGWGDAYTAAPWAMFSTNSGDGNLWARTNDGAMVDDFPLGTQYIGGLHTYRIDLLADGVHFYIDGTPVHTSPPASFPAATLRPLFSDLNARSVLEVPPSSASDYLMVDWMRVKPYAASGTYTSAPLDAGATTTWRAITFGSDVPAGTTLNLSVRTSPDGVTWTNWIAKTSGADVGQSNRYLQYQVSMTSSGTNPTDPSTPLLQYVEVQYGP